MNRLLLRTLPLHRPLLCYRAASTVQSVRPAQTAAADMPISALRPPRSSSPRRPSSYSRIMHMDGVRDYLQASPRDEKSINKAVLVASRIPQTSVSLMDLQQFGVLAEKNMPATLLNASAFLARELPIRFAHRIAELQTLPFGLAESPSVKKVASWYKQSFADITLAPIPQNTKTEAEWSHMLERIYLRHGPTLVTMARAIYELKSKYSVDGVLAPEIEETVFPFLDRFYTSRIGIRTLIAQHLELRNPRQGYVGIIDLCSSPSQIASAAIADARFMCERTFGDAPKVDIVGNLDFTLPYVPQHLQHIMFELVKNSMRAVVETHSDKDVLPKVKVIISAGRNNEDVVIKVADEGGGIARSAMPRIWSYFFTTFPANFSRWADEDSSDFSTDTPLAGLGYGLPLSRLYARYFGGDLQVISMEGFGTDAYIHLKNVGDAMEPLYDCSNSSSSDDESIDDVIRGLSSNH